MKTVIDGNVFDTEKMKPLASRSAYSNGNYAGETWVGLTASGKLAIVVESNGQDLYRKNLITAVSKEDCAAAIEGWELSKEEAKRLVAEGIIGEA